jgi:type I restriction enzyme, S subunit
MLNAPQSLDVLERMKTGISDSGLNLTQAKFLELSIPKFSLSDQKGMVRRIEIAFSWINRLASEATSAHKLIDHLHQAGLAKAFRGELVPQDPNDEPASVLLERIRAERAAAAPAASRHQTGVVCASEFLKYAGYTPVRLPVVPSDAPGWGQ